eukprot:2426126-Pleurochrysis_carterae.AAC.1
MASRTQLASRLSHGCKGRGAEGRNQHDAGFVRHQRSAQTADLARFAGDRSGALEGLDVD